MTPIESVAVEVRERVEVEVALRVAVVVAEGRGVALMASEKVREGVPPAAEAEAPLLLLALRHWEAEGVPVGVLPAPSHRLGEALVEGERELEAERLSPLPRDAVTLAVALGVVPYVPLAWGVRVPALVWDARVDTVAVLPELLDAVAALLLLPPCPALGVAPGEAVGAGEPLPCMLAEGVREDAKDAVRAGEGVAVPLPPSPPLPLLPPPLVPVGQKVGGGGTVPAAEAVAGV